MTGKSRPKIIVLMGGPSSERDVSLVSGQKCAQALCELGYETCELDAGSDLDTHLKKIKPDVVFNALHGRWGEDGTVQGVLEWHGLAYTHSGVLASALAMDKERAKAVFRDAGLPVAHSLVIAKADFKHAHPMDVPYVIKPINEGSSVGVHKITNLNVPAPISDINAPDTLMVEAFIPGRELTVSVLGNKPLGVTEIITDTFYDYNAKYTPGASRHIVPADIPEEISEAAMSCALRAHHALGCKGLTRSDFRWDCEKERDGLILLEVNTQPGMTPTSLSPEQAAMHDINFSALCDWIVKDASCNR